MIEDVPQRIPMALPKPSSVVIFYSPGDAWRMGTLLPYDPSSGTAQVQDAENRQLYTVRLPEDVHVMSSPLPFPDEMEDLMMLSDINDGPLLCSLRVRYQDDKYCTALGRDHLLLINPVKAIQKMPMEHPHLYLQDQPGLPSHPCQVASRALNHVNNTDQDAIIILSGDPGSGKTTCQKDMLSLLFTQLPHAARHRTPLVTLRMASTETDASAYVNTVAKHINVPKDSVEVVSLVDVPSEGGMPMCELTFKFEEKENGVVAKDFQSLEKVPTALKEELRAVTSVVNEPRTWPCEGVLTIMESLCNARTTRNVNASKAIILNRLAVSDGTIMGSELRTYLLDSNRSVRPPLGERNFHIFYYLLAGASDWERDRYHLPMVEELYESSFNVLGKPRTAPTDSTRSWEQSMASMNVCSDWTGDVEELTSEYEHLIDAFDTCKVSHRLQDWIFRVLSAILHLGQVTFVSSPNRGGATIVPSSSKQSLVYAGECLQLNIVSLESALTTHIQRVRSEEVDIRLTPAQSAAARDSLIRSLYEKVVDVTVVTLNDNLAPTEEVSGWLSILDFVGTEDGAHNDLVALSHNYANEVLQDFYNKATFDKDVSECADELGDSCQVEVVKYKEVYSIVKLLRANHGVFSIIDEECTNPKPSDAVLLDTLTKKLINHPKYERKPSAVNFTIKHSSGDIEYNISGMTSLNRNSVLPNDIRQCLTVSLCKYTAQAFLTPQELKERRLMEMQFEHSNGALEVPPDFVGVNARLHSNRSTSDPTFLTRIRRQIHSLFQLCESSKPFFVRCIKPTKGSAGTVFHGRYIMRQLNTLGVLDTLKQKQMSYPVRLSYNVLLRTIWILANEVKGASDREKVEFLCQQHSLGERDFRAGKTVAFLSKNAYTLLLDAQRLKENSYAEIVQAWCKGLGGVQKVNQNVAAIIEEIREQTRLRYGVQQKLRWEAERAKREAAEKLKVSNEETRYRRNIDNQEAVDYITIMTGLIEGVDIVREQRSQRMKIEERNKQRHLIALLNEEKANEQQKADERLEHRMLAQGGKLDRILAKKFEEAEKLRNKRVKSDNNQQRVMQNKIAAEKGRLAIEKRLLEKEMRHSAFVEAKKNEREMVESRRMELRERDKKAKEARSRARQAWEESKREEFELDNLEREVIHRVETELLESKKREGYYDRVSKEEAARRSSDKLLAIERARARKQLLREKLEKEEAETAEAARKKRERQVWAKQQEERRVAEETSKIQLNLEKKRFARRQREKTLLSAPRTFTQELGLQTTPARSVSRERMLSRSPSRSVSPAGRLNPPGYRPPADFVMSNGKKVAGTTYTSQTTRGLNNYYDAITRSASPYRSNLGVK